MSIALALALVAAAEGPQRAEQIHSSFLEHDWWQLVSNGDFDATASTFFEVLISPLGKPERCTVLVSSGNQKLDGAVCSYVKQEFRYRPALNSLGEPTYGLIERILNVIAAEPKSHIFRTGPDYILEVSHLPKQYSPQQETVIDVEINEQGDLHSCAVPKRQSAISQSGYQTKKLPKALADLSQVACAELPKIWDPMPARASDGRPISYVRSVRVLFTVPGTAAAATAPARAAAD